MTSPSAGPGHSWLSELAQPSPLTAIEEADPRNHALARRFNPAMALPTNDVWPTEVGYAWHDQADLVARVTTSGRATEYVAVPNAQLPRTDWSSLPDTTAEGDPIRYYVDAPGDDRPVGRNGISGWRQRWRDIIFPNGVLKRPSETLYPPTQYVHVFWWNRDRDLLAIQYWFYYPYNEWVNHHEGDWEHIQVILRTDGGIGDPEPTVLGYQFFFHDNWLETTNVSLSREDEGEHPIVFVGGTGRLMAWAGEISGGSYPWPGRYANTAFSSLVVSSEEEVGEGARFLSASEFKIVLLPEPARLDARQNPELSWLRLPFFAGQRTVFVNPPLFSMLEEDHPPINPARRRLWLAPPSTTPWGGRYQPSSTKSFAQIHGSPVSAKRKRALPKGAPPSSPKLEPFENPS